MKDEDKMSNKHQCRDCKLLLATQYDFDTIPSGEGQHLCWRQFTGDVCTGNPIEWQMRCYQAEAEITALRKEVKRVRMVAENRRHADGYSVVL